LHSALNSLLAFLSLWAGQQLVAPWQLIAALQALTLKTKQLN
jgi:hypothetical protein